MNKSGFLKKLGLVFTILGGAFLCIALTSCENFLTGEDIKDDIVETIEIANSSALTYHIIADKDSGTVTPAQIHGKKKETFEIMFTPSDNWKFLNWEVLDRTTGEPVTGALSFADETKLETKVTIISPKENLMIHPKCVLLPAITDIYPPYNPAGYNQDTVIRITFNKPVSPESFGNFKCISFTSELQDISSCYGEPFFSSNNTILYIPLANGERIIEEQEQVNTKEVTISINCSGLLDADGLSIAQNQPYTYCLKKDVDTTKPIITQTEVLTTADTGSWYYRSLTNTPFEQWDYNEAPGNGGSTYYYGDYSRNNISNSIHVNLQGYDNLDAITAVCVREVFQKDSSGSTASENEIISYFTDFVPVTDAGGEVVLSDTGNAIQSFNFDYNLRSSANGLVHLEISLVDNAGKHSVPEMYDVIKKSSTDREILFQLEVDDDNTFPVFNASTNQYESYIHVKEEGDFLITNDSFYTGCKTTCDKFALYIYDKNDKPQVLYELNDFVITDSSKSIKNELNAILASKPIDSFSDTKLKALIREANGISREIEFVIPVGPVVLDLKNPGSTTTSTSFTLYTSIGKISSPLKENAGDPKPYTMVQIYSSGYTKKYVNPTWVSLNESATYKFYRKQDVVYDYIGDSTVRTAYGRPFAFKLGDIYTVVIQKSFSMDFSIKDEMHYENNNDYVLIDFEVEFPEDEYTYYIVSPDYGYCSAPYGKSVYAYNGNYPDFQIYRFDANGLFAGRSTQKRSKSVTAQDTFAPLLKLQGTYTDSSFFNVYCNAYAINSGDYGWYDLSVGSSGNPSYILHVKAKNYKIYCYYVSENLYENPTLDALEEKKILKQKLIADQNGDDVNWTIPFADLEQGMYYIYMYVEDSAGNYSINRVGKDEINGFVTGVNFYLKDASPSVEYVSDKNLKLNNPEGYDSVKMQRYILKEENDVCKWELYDSNNYEYSSSNAATDYASVKDHFVKVCARESSGNYGLYHFKPYYYYPNYENKEFTCKNTSWMKVDNGYQIFCDAPAFCHTLYSTRKITSGNTEKDALEWEAQAQETGIVVSENGSGFTYKNTNLAGVPAGSWYTTICHFADGTVLMSPVQKK